MMNTVYNEKDIEIHKNGISVDGTFFTKEKIADAFNELSYLHRKRFQD